MGQLAFEGLEVRGNTLEVRGKTAIGGVDSLRHGQEVVILVKVKVGRVNFLDDDDLGVLIRQHQTKPVEAFVVPDTHSPDVLFATVKDEAYRLRASADGQGRLDDLTREDLG